LAAVQGSWAGLGRLLAGLGPVFAGSWQVWGESGPLLAALGLSWPGPGHSWANLGPILGRSWASLGVSWTPRGRFWRALGRCSPTRSARAGWKPGESPTSGGGRERREDRSDKGTYYSRPTKAHTAGPSLSSSTSSRLQAPLPEQVRRGGPKALLACTGSWHCR
jgi:hypothetical protein